MNNTDDDFDDFDPRGTSTSKYSEQTVFNIAVANSIHIKDILSYSFKLCINYYGAHFTVLCVVHLQLAHTCLPSSIYFLVETIIDYIFVGSIFYLLNDIVSFFSLSTEASAGSSNQVDLFGQDLIGDLMDAPASVSVEKPAASCVSEVDLFADAAFVSAAPHVDKGASSQPQVIFHCL